MSRFPRFRSFHFSSVSRTYVMAFAFATASILVGVHHDAVFARNGHDVRGTIISTRQLTVVRNTEGFQLSILQPCMQENTNFIFFSTICTLSPKMVTTPTPLIPSPKRWKMAEENEPPSFFLDSFPKEVLDDSVP